MEVLRDTRHTFEDTNSGREVVDTASSLQGRSEDLNGGDKVIGEAVVEVTLGRHKLNIVSVINFLSWLLCGMQSGRDAWNIHDRTTPEDRGFPYVRTRTCQLTWSSKTSWTPSNSFSNLS